MRKRSYTPLPPDTDPKILGLFTRNRSFYKMFFPLLLVIALQQLAALAVNLADNLMLGRYTELALSGKMVPKSHGWRSLVGCSPWGREESDTTE